MIIFNSVSKHFGPDTQPALEDVSFDIQPGELVLVTGRSGSGKTTLMKLMTKEYLPTAGEITIDDTPLSAVKSAQAYQIRRKIGVVFQDYRLLPELTVWENIALALSIIHTDEQEIEQRVADLLELTGLSEKAFLFPQQLSGGEAQRVSIARALSTAPKVIFADEPTGNLDEETSKSIVQLLQKINELGTTLLVTTHDVMVKEMLKGERNMILDRGKLVEDSGQKSGGKKSKAKAEAETSKAAKPTDEPTNEPPETKNKKEESDDESETTPSAPEKKSRPRLQFKLPNFGKLFKRSLKTVTPDKDTDQESAKKPDEKSEDPEEVIVEVEHL
ncbi:MAG TPA: ATP-binding cassette domain-containing protein [Patescibacteria group bacterium]